LTLPPAGLLPTLAGPHRRRAELVQRCRAGRDGRGRRPNPGDLRI